jgi:hypothetical protein
MHIYFCLRPTAKQKKLNILGTFYAIKAQKRLKLTLSISLELFLRDFASINDMLR